MSHPNGNTWLFETDTTGEYVYMLKPWRDYLAKKARALSG